MSKIYVFRVTLQNGADTISIQEYIRASNIWDAIVSCKRLFAADTFVRQSFIGYAMEQ